jgi:hypothetical protein
MTGEKKMYPNKDMKTEWVENLDWEIEEIVGNRTEHLSWQLHWYAERPFTRFDATFYKREPILEVTLNKSYARNLCAALMYDQEPRRLKELLDHVKFSDGTVVKASEIWALNLIPDDLDVNGIDLARAEEVVIGFGGETLREIIRDTYRCRSRAEEDHFIARWIAS